MSEETNGGPNIRTDLSMQFTEKQNCWQFSETHKIQIFIYIYLPTAIELMPGGSVYILARKYIVFNAGACGTCSNNRTLIS
jgi:hypothetical protein